MILTSFTLEELKSIFSLTVKETFENYLKEQAGKQLRTQKEGANQLKVTPPTFRKYVKKGLIPELVIDGSKRYRQADLDNALKTIKKYGIN